MKLFVKNMVCPRCITAVEKVLSDMELKPVNVQLGTAETGIEPDERQLIILKLKLKETGFELLEDSKLQIVDKIKSAIINHIHHTDNTSVVFSELLAGELHRDYSGLSKLFSATEGITIEQFIILQKIEKVKELLLYNELSLSQIADAMGYSSVAHLSAQFRKYSGLTPTAFRQTGATLRLPLDRVAKKV